jgi:hypothetical protein
MRSNAGWACSFDDGSSARAAWRGSQWRYRQRSRSEPGDRAGHPVLGLRLLLIPQRPPSWWANRRHPRLTAGLPLPGSAWLAAAWLLPAVGLTSVALERWTWTTASGGRGECCRRRVGGESLTSTVPEWTIGGSVQRQRSVAWLRVGRRRRLWLVAQNSLTIRLGGIHDHDTGERRDEVLRSYPCVGASISKPAAGWPACSGLTGRARRRCSE